MNALPRLSLSILLTVLLFTWSCTDGPGPAKRGVYYWSTSFALDSTKLDFIRKHNVERIYLRLFDVVSSVDGLPKPNATVLFPDTFVNVPSEIVPVVYIHNDVMRSENAELQHQILNRVLQMAETHGFAPIKEMQIDCDWTTSTRKIFFTFMDSLHSLTREKGLTLSVTIRLHQLSQKAPSADKGILMVYNTGDMTRLDVEKPILDIEDVKPYLKYLAGYPLPLTTAYPIYRWDLLFRNGSFVDIIHSPDEVPIMSDDSVVTRQPSAGDILESRKAIESIRPGCASEILLFDLNNYNINRYTYDQFETFYN